MKTITSITYCAFALLAFICFAVAPRAQAACQDACLSNNNTVQGDNALIANTTGTNNTAIGFQALSNNTTGVNNMAVGVDAMTIANDGGSNNTAIGYFALFNNTGSHNTAVGYNAGINLTTGSNNIDVGAFVVAGESNTIRIGKQGLQNAALVQGIYGKTVANGVGVIVGSNGLLGTMVSSVRFKDAVEPMDKASETILALKPVTFRYKHELDPEGIPQFGLVAEDVAKVNPDLVVRDEQGKPYTVRYEAVNAMLLNEFLKEHKKVEEQQTTIAQLKSTVAQQQKGFDAKLAKQEEQIETLTVGLQKVSAQVEASKPAPQVVNNP